MNSEWSDLAARGWQSAMAGDEQRAINYWEAADALAHKHSDWRGLSINPELSMRRFRPGQSTGVVISPIPNEDLAIGLRFADWWPEHHGGDIEKAEHLSAYPSEDQIARHMERSAITDEGDSPHLMVMSTGRCGTISLAHLLNTGGYMAYHNCPFNVDMSSKILQMVNLEYPAFLAHSQKVEDTWLKTRRAEWLGAEDHFIPVALCSHLDTVFAPTFAKAHGHSKFVYLHRNESHVFKSFYTKSQWGPSQLMPVDYSKSPSAWSRRPMDVPAQIAWYVRYTENFSRAFGKVIGGDRFIEISADHLFAGDRDEMVKLMEFTGLEKTLDEVEEFYREPLNAKIHKTDNTNLEAGLEIFLKAYESMR